LPHGDPRPERRWLPREATLPVGQRPRIPHAIDVKCLGHAGPRSPFFRPRAWTRCFVSQSANDRYLTAPVIRSHRFPMCSRSPDLSAVIPLRHGYRRALDSRDESCFTGSSLRPIEADARGLSILVSRESDLGANAGLRLEASEREARTPLCSRPEKACDCRRPSENHLFRRTFST